MRISFPREYHLLIIAFSDSFPQVPVPQNSKHKFFRYVNNINDCVFLPMQKVIREIYRADAFLSAIYSVSCQ